MRNRLGMVSMFLVLSGVLAGCQAPRPSGTDRPQATQSAARLPEGARTEEIVHADLTGDGRDEMIAAITFPAQDDKPAVAVAVVSAMGKGGRYTQVLRRNMGGGWLPIQIGRPAEEAPLAAVFATRAGSGGFLDYIVVQQRSGGLRITLEQDGLFGGGVRFVPEGLLESRGDTDRLYRWGAAGWEAEDLGSQYLPPMPAGTVVISYTVDPVRGPRAEGPRTIRARVGQHLFLRRLDRGEPSRIQFSGGADSTSIQPDGLIALRQADQIQIHIEGPAYSGRTLTLLLRIDR
ncbi:MAG: hypothetical protein RDU83_04455 [bacterium]|nr:hypothetical protein [bacterium]